MLKNATSASQGMLIFALSQTQSFAMGTLKIREIIPYQRLTVIPNAHPFILGSTHFRGITLPVIDMAKAIGYRSITADERSQCSIIVTDCHNMQVGFLVRKINKIVEFDWGQIIPAPDHMGHSLFVTGILNVGEQLVQLLDIELILANVFPDMHSNTHPVVTDVQREKLRPLNILLVDDSAVARRQLSDALDSISIPYSVTKNGKEALALLHHAAATQQAFDIVVSDIEMPGLDGYELAFEIQNTAVLNRAYIILHTSISSEISVSQARQVGAHEALTKFDANELVHAMLRGADYHTAMIS
uniref:chemotaxis protein n=1 Tax=Thaumasiovibrio occultus TaxID=1891184 RepID=UPI000B35482F|nr:chemotaxis protein [Thaumasiovibrio occultus]